LNILVQGLFRLLPARAAMRRSNGDAFADSEKKDIFMHGIARSLFSQG
jgi:hypothetical protein